MTVIEIGYDGAYRFRQYRIRFKCSKNPDHNYKQRTYNQLDCVLKMGDIKL